MKSTAKSAAKATAKSTGPAVSKRQYESLARFRYELRRYMRYSEEITRRHGVTPLQYQLLLQIKGYPQREYATVGELAERLQAKHHGAVSLVTRCERAGLVARRPSEDDRRVVHVFLTAKGERCLERLAELHRSELLKLQGQFFVPDGEDL
ncbi:MAG TPA: MarR family transcriptional regulator [Steroidobacteraceae bacterium]